MCNPPKRDSTPIPPQGGESSCSDNLSLNRPQGKGRNISTAGIRGGGLSVSAPGWEQLPLPLRRGRRVPDQTGPRALSPPSPLPPRHRPEHEVRDPQQPHHPLTW